MTNSVDIQSRVIKVLVHALGIEETDVRPSSTIMGDLGTQSIDFLDIIFRLEREFAIKIRQGELFSERILEEGADFVHDGRLTDDGLAALRDEMPYADLMHLERDRRLE